MGWRTRAFKPEGIISSIAALPDWIDSRSVRSFVRASRSRPDRDHADRPRSRALPRFRERCFTEAERAYCESRPNPPQHYAARFAGKEAVGKALGSGVRFTWREIEIAGRPKPGVTLSGKTKAWAERVGAGTIELSMTHSRDLAQAVCLVSDA